MGLEAGQVIDGKYRIIKVLGIGGMGAVYEGENVRIHRKVAIKLLHAEVASKADIVQRFEREAQAAGRIGSQHIVEVLDLGNLPSGERFMVMEYLDGEPLTNRIKVRGRMSPHDLAPLLRQILDGLSAAHAAGIIHRDLKPDNVYVVKRGGQDFVKILDFGVSKFSGAENEFSMTRTGAVMGTPYYMSPEQARGQQIDQRSDLYSIGVVAYQAVTGRVPFHAETFNELIFKIALEAPEPIENVVQGFDPGFAAIIKKAMMREPQHRFSTAQEFMHAIDAWRAGAPMPQGYAPQAMPSNPGHQGHHQGSGAFSNSGLGMSGGNLGVSASLGQSGGNPVFSQSGQNPAFGRSGAGHPMGTSGAPVAQAPMGQSQIGLSVTTRETKRTPIVAAVAIMAVLGIGGGLAAFKFSGTSSAGATPAQTGAPATDTAKPETTAAETAKPETPPAETAKPEATTAPTTEATTEATAESTSAPVAQNPGRPTRPGPGPGPKPPTQPTSKPATQPSTGSGRSIGTDL